MSELEVRTVRVKLGPRFWRNPVVWTRFTWGGWKFRRAFNKLDPKVQEAIRDMERDMERAFLFGDSDGR